MTVLWRLLNAPANWCGLLLASAVLLLQANGLLGLPGFAIALLGYAAGFVGGGLWLGFPAWRDPVGSACLDDQTDDKNDARQAMENALAAVRQRIASHPEQRFPAALRNRVLTLCRSLDELLRQWESSRGTLSLQDGFDARHIATRYLPDALNAYLSIPAPYAAERRLDNGKTAQETFKDTLAELEDKVRELADDLAAQDAQAFLQHSRFLRRKFAENPLTEMPALDLPPPENLLPPRREG